MGWGRNLEFFDHHSLELVRNSRSCCCRKRSNGMLKKAGHLEEGEEEEGEEAAAAAFIGPQQIQYTGSFLNSFCVEEEEQQHSLCLLSSS
jgi:hypothetical protein